MNVDCMFPVQLAGIEGSFDKMSEIKTGIFSLVIAANYNFVGLIFRSGANNGQIWTSPALLMSHQIGGGFFELDKNFALIT